METLFVIVSLLAGALLAVQAGANAQLSKATGSPFVATALQLSVGALGLLLIAVLTGTVAALALLPHAPWWHAIGGVASALYVVSTIVLFPRLGAVVTVGLFIAGQMFASLTLDSFGWFGLTPKTLDAATLFGTLAVVLGAAGIVFGQPGTSWAQQSQQIEGKLGWMALALVAGAVLPVQGALNALLRADLGAPFVVGTVSFLVATLAMAAVQLVITTVEDAPKSPAGGVAQMAWWGWLGGFAGATYVTTMFTAIRSSAPRPPSA